MYLIKYVALAFVLNTVYGIKEIELNNLNLKTISSLINILSKYKNSVKYLEIQQNNLKANHGEKIDKLSHNEDDIGDADDLTSYKKFVNLEKRPKKTLIKRLIPHGMPPSKYEFDRKYKTIYKPLVRVHKRKPLPKIHTILNLNGDVNVYVLDKYGIDIHDYYDNDEDVVNFVTDEGRYDQLEELNREMDENDTNEVLLQPFGDNIPGNKVNIAEITSQLRILKEIKKLLKNTHSRSVRLKTFDKIMQVLDKIDLRSFAKSGEDDHPMTQGRPVHWPGEYEDATPKPKKLMPHYPPWNFWTYHKTIHQDECPKQQVKINNRCIWIPPH